MRDKYRNFAELSKNEKKGEDYEIIFRDKKSSIVIVAPHGGGIEPLTKEIAEEIAGNEFSLYIFEGLKRRDNSNLHLTSTSFDEPQALRFVAKHQLAIAIHGKRGSGSYVEVGGRNERFVSILIYELNVCGVDARLPSSKNIAGKNPENICNRSADGGVQLELTRGLRDHFHRAKSAVLKEAIKTSFSRPESN